MTSKETLDFIRSHRTDDVCRLSLSSAPKGVDLPLALRQIEGWQTARRKLPSWAEHEELLYPPRLSMEQCSSELTAEYKVRVAERWLSSFPCDEDGRVFIDLTGGLGVDFSFLAKLFPHAVYMERNPELCRLAAHNFQVLGLRQAEVVNADSALSPADWPEADCLLADPARRDTHGRKTVAVEDCEPNLIALQEQLRAKARFCLIKLSPMLDISAALHALAHIAEVHVVSVKGECKELLLVMTRRAPEATTFHCVNLDSGQPDFLFTQAEEEAANCLTADMPERYLYEPNASLMKCGGFKSVAARYGLKKLHPNTHLYTSDSFCSDFPGRTFVVDAHCGWGKKEIKTALSDLDKANLTVRNFPETVETLRKRLKLKEGGDTYLFATTLADNRRVLLRCHKP